MNITLYDDSLDRIAGNWADEGSLGNYGAVRDERWEMTARFGYVLAKLRLI